MNDYLPLLAIAIDTALGDPRTKIHPVVLMGALIAWLEQHLRKPAASAVTAQWSGLLLVAIVLATTYTLTWAAIELLTLLDPLLALAGGALLLSFAIAPRSLAEAGYEIRNYLLQDNLVQARVKVGWIVGRDTDALTAGEVSRATVETIAENIVDGIISPLFYFAIGGIPLALLYRAVNTMDSMLGYKNDKYLHFGRAAAKTDDLFNLIPARITALLIVIVAAVLRYDAANAFCSVRRDACKHPSPNSGYAEAAVAGALKIRLGGLNYYGGIASFRAHMGISQQTPQAEHICSTIVIMYAVTMLFTLLLLGLHWG